MNLKKRWIAITLLIMSGMSNQTKAFANSVFSNPFDEAKSNSKSATNSVGKSEALDALSHGAKGKIDTDFLDAVMDKDSSDLIVEYVSAESEPDVDIEDNLNKLNEKKKAHKEIKQKVIDSFNFADYELLNDYDALPMNFVRIKNRTALVKLLNHGNVKAVYENKAHKHFLVQSLPFISQPQAVLTGITGTGASVAVLDTGVNYTNSAFNSCTSPGVPSSCRVVAAVDTASDDGALDADGHGTNVAGIVAGVAPGAKIEAIDVFTGELAYSNHIIAGINWVINNKSQFNIVAMNLSLGGGQKYTSECPSSWAATPFSNARTAGVIPVVSAGNDGFIDGVPEPACAPGALRVGAVYDANVGGVSYGSCSDSSTYSDLVACFSNGGNMLTLFAPGVFISAAGVTASGTSQAAPHVAGAVAVLRASNAAPNDTLDQTTSRLTSTGKTLTDYRNQVKKPRLDLYSAVNSINPTTPLSFSKIAPAIQLLLE